MTQLKVRDVLRSEDWPTLLTLATLVASLLAFGADTRSGALAISALIFSITLCGLLFARGFSVTYWSFPFLLVWGGLVALHAVTHRIGDGSHEYIVLLSAGCVFWAGRYAALSYRRRERTMRLLVLLSFAIGFLSFIQHIAFPGTVLGIQKAYHLDRLSGPFLSANTFATFSGMLVLFLLYYLIKSVELGRENYSHLPHSLSILQILARKPLALSALAFLTVDLLLTQSRAGVGAFVLSAIVLFSIIALQPQSKSEKAPGKATLVFGLIGLTVILFSGLWWISGSGIEERLQSSDATSSQYRQVIADISWQAGLSSPWFGHGLESFNIIKDYYATPENNKIIISQNASHNLYLQWFVQAGWPGLIGVCLLFLTLIVRALIAQQSMAMKGLQIAIIALLLTHGFFDYGLEIPAVLLWSAYLFGLSSTKPAGNSANSTKIRHLSTLSNRLRLVIASAIAFSFGAISFLFVVQSLETGSSFHSMSSGELKARLKEPPFLPQPYYFSELASALVKQSPPAFADARIATLRSLEGDPRKPTNWLRLAYIDASTQRPVSEDAQNALLKTYDLSPYGEVDEMQWRLQFGNEVWDELSDELKRLTLTQITALSFEGWNEQQWLKAFARTAHPDIKARIRQSVQ